MDAHGDLAELIGWYRQPSGAARAEFEADAGPEVLQAIGEVPGQVAVGADTLVIKAEPWRDFMPGSWPAGGSPLMVVITVATRKAGVFPPLLRPEWVAVVNRSRVWMTPGVIEALSFAPGQDSYRVVVRRGPVWGPGIDVDVLLQLRDRQGRGYCLRAPSAPIIETC